MADFTRPSRTKGAIIQLVQVSTTPTGLTRTITRRTARRPTARLRTDWAAHLAHGAKTVAAALPAWGIAAPWSPGGHPYLAVATAFLMVNASTVYRSVTQAARNVSAKVAGLVLALMTVRLLGATAGAVAVIALVAVLAGPRRGTDDRLQIASTAVVALAATAAGPMNGLVSPVLQTLAGAVVGILVNALVLPPLHLDASDSAVHEVARAMANLLDDMGTGLGRHRLASGAHAWLHRARGLEQRLTRAEEQVRNADESLRWNTRCLIHGRRKETAHSETFNTLRGVSLQVRGIARTLADNASDQHSGHRLGQEFLARYAETLQLAGEAVREFTALPTVPGPSGTASPEQLRMAIDRALAWHTTMTGLIGEGSLTKPGAWHLYGSLMTDMERLLADLDHEHARRAMRLAFAPR